MKHGLFLGLVVGLVAPAGDLFESMIKRDLGIKDSGTVASRPRRAARPVRLHHSLALPAAYYVAQLFNLSSSA